MGAMSWERPIRVVERAVRPVERLGIAVGQRVRAGEPIAVERRIRAIDEQ